MLAIGISLAVFIITYRRLWGFLQDDVFISLRYAQHLAQGIGLVYNAGERVEGYTNFLWTVLLAVPFLFGWAVVPFLKMASAVFAILSAWTLWRLGRATFFREENRALGRLRA